MRTLRQTLAVAITLLSIATASPARAQTTIQPGTHGSVTLMVLDGATSLAGGVLRVAAREARDDEDAFREAVLYQIPRFDSPPAAFTAPMAFTPATHTRIVLINSDDAIPIRVRAAFYDRDGHPIGCHDMTLDPHARRSARVQEIPLSPCP